MVRSFKLTVFEKAERKKFNKKQITHKRSQRKRLKCPTCGYRAKTVKESVCPRCQTGLTEHNPLNESIPEYTRE